MTDHTNSDETVATETENSREAPTRTIDYGAVLQTISEVEEEVLAEDKLGASRDQIVEGTCQRIRDRLRDAGEPVDSTELTEEEALAELGGGASTASIDSDDLFTDGGEVAATDQHSGVVAHRFTVCPGCDGELQYQTRSDAECRSCGDVYHHEIRSGRHLLWSYTDAGSLDEVVSRVAPGSEESDNAE